jgi:SnoaL-like domain
MKKSVTFLIVMVLAGGLHAQRPVAKKEQAVHQTIIKLFEALSNRDSISLKTNSTADITLFEYSQVWTIDTLILKAITQNQSADFKRTNSFEFINTSINKNMAWTTYHLQSVIVKEDKQTTVQWLETVTLVKERKRWKVKHLHSTLIKRM